MIAAAQGDLFADFAPTCGSCASLGAAIESGIRYCFGEMTWRWSFERVDGCEYRGRAIFDAPAPRCAA